MILFIYIYSVFCGAQIDCDEKRLYSEMGKFLNKERCVSLYSGKYECLTLKNKSTYIHPKIESFSDEWYLNSADKAFDFSSYQQLIKNQMDSLRGTYIPKVFFDPIKTSMVNDSIKAEIIISLSPFFLFKDYKYCILDIQDIALTMRWVVKLKFIDDKIDSFAIDLISD